MRLSESVPHLKRPRTADTANDLYPPITGREGKRRRLPHGSGDRNDPQQTANSASHSVTDQAHGTGPVEKTSCPRGHWSASYPTGGHYVDLDPIVTGDEQ